MIFVENEFAPLKKVVLAQSEFGYPKKPRLEDLRFLTQEAVQENFENRGKDHADAFPELQKVEYIDFSISRSFGGSFWCSTQPISRY